MVCVPCFMVPVILIIWRFLIQPLLVKWWQLRNKGQEAEKDQPCPDLMKESNKTCTPSWKEKGDAVKKSD